MHNTDWHGTVLLDSFSTLFSLSEPAIHSLGYTEDQDWMVYVFPPLSSGVTNMWVIPDFYIHNEDTNIVSMLDQQARFPLSYSVF